MKRLILLVAVLLIALVAGFCLNEFGDLQKTQATAYVDKTPVVETNPMAIKFSHNDTFYDTKIEVAITCANKNAQIYYSTDGSDPNATSKKYNEPIAISAKSTVNATTLKAVAIDGENQSEIAVKSYVTGKNVFARFDPSTLVFVLSTDPYNLYDYYYGVAVEGYVRDEYLQSDDYDGGELEYNAPANWYISGRESERPMYVEVYDSTGKKLLEQASGARVVGGYSRANSQKSWRLIARNEYSEGNGMFSYAFFNNATDAYGQLLTKYDRITLRDNANDREFASIRDEVSLELAKQAGFPDVQETRPAAVFLNGEYYGFAWLHEAYCNGYFEQTYGGIKENYRMVDGKESEISADDEQSEKDYYYIYELAENGLTDNEKFEEFSSLVDVDNLLLYNAIQIYIDNKDWPGNNFRAWRYYPSEGEEATGYQDGKWRFMLFDVEYAWSLYGSGYNASTLSDVLNGNHMQGTSVFLNALLERDDMREKFANIMCDLISGAFAPENALAVINEKIEECDDECMYALENGYTSEWANRHTFEESREQIRTFAINRPRIIYANLVREFDIENSDKYKVVLNNPTGAQSRINTQTLTLAGSASGEYFTCYSVPVSTDVYSGYEFDYWEVNGEKITEQSFSVNYDMVDENGTIDISLHLNRVYEEQPLFISELYTAGDGDWIELYNPNNIAISTDGYYLSDDIQMLNRWRIPAVTVEPGETLVIVCKNNKDLSALHKLVTNFSLKTGETLYLSDSNGTVFSRTAVIDMDSEQSLSRNSDGSYSPAIPTMGVYRE